MPDGMLRAAHGARRFALGALALGALGGCAINDELTVVREGPGVAPGAAIALQGTADGQADAGGFGAAVAAALAAGGHALRDDGEVVGITAFTRGAATTGIADPAAGGGAAAGEIAWISAPRRRGMFDSCAGDRLRATLALFARDSGALLYRATGEVDGCGFAAEDVEALAARLVAESAQ